MSDLHGFVAKRCVPQILVRAHFSITSSKGGGSQKNLVLITFDDGGGGSTKPKFDDD